MKHILFALLLLVQGTLYSQTIYPTHWFTGMKNPNLQLIIHRDRVAQEKISMLPYAGVKLLKQTKVENPNYLFIVLQISATAKQGKIKFRIDNLQSPEAVSYRMKKMKEMGVLKKYSADLDYRKLGFHWFMIIFKLNKISKDLDNKIRLLCNPRSKIRYVDKTIDHRIRIQILANNLEEVNEEISVIRAGFEGSIEDYEVLPLFDQYVLTTMPKGIYDNLLASVK